jgi:hypothetical protein
VPLHRVLGESIRIIIRQPSTLLVPLEALLIGAVAVLLVWWVGEPGNTGARVAIWWFAGFILWVYTSAAVWGSAIDAAGGGFSVRHFWKHGIVYFVRTFLAAALALVHLIPAAALSIFAILMWGTIYNNARSQLDFVYLQTVMRYAIWCYLAIGVAWLINCLWASWRLVVEWPSLLASGIQGREVRGHILQARKSEVTALWLCLIILTGAVIFLFTMLGMFSFFGVVRGEIQNVFSIYGGGGMPTYNPFGNVGAPTTLPSISISEALRAIGPHSPSVPVSVPVVSQINTPFIKSLVALFVAWVLSYLLQTCTSLLCVVYYRFAGGSAAWFLPGTARHNGTVKRRSTASPLTRREVVSTAGPPSNARKPIVERLTRGRERLRSALHNIVKKGTRVSTKLPEARELMSARLSQQWARSRELFNDMVPVVSRVVAAVGAELPDFRPLVTGKILPLVRELLTALEHGPRTFTRDITARSATAIPVAAFTLLGLGVMIGWGGALGICLLAAIVGFAFGIAVLRVGVAAERFIIPNRSQTAIAPESAQMDLAGATVGVLFGAALVLLVSVVLRFFGAASFGITSALNSLAIGTVFPLTAALISLRGLTGWRAILVAGLFTTSILCAWLFLLELIVPIL